MTVAANLRTPALANEPVLDYRPGSPERTQLVEAQDRIYGACAEIPLFIGSRQQTTNQHSQVCCPHQHGHVLAKVHQGGQAEVEQAIAAAEAAAPSWQHMDWQARAAIFLRAAELASTRYRATLNAATMLGQSKTVREAEIDSACELVDFLRFNVRFYSDMLNEQPQSPTSTWNMLDYRPLEGFVLAITPFNFTAIAANLPTAPALLGNTVVWKPAPAAMLSSFYLMRLLQEAGLPDGVINMVSGPAEEIAKQAIAHPHLAGIHFTGSTAVFRSLWQQVGQNIERYRCYPRLVGETGGKDFILAHPSAEKEAVLTAIVRGAFEYQGQKCSAASRVYLPQSLYEACRDQLIEETSQIKMGSPTDFHNFMAAVINRTAFDRIQGYINRTKAAKDAKIVAGGECDDTVGYFVRPTIIETSNPAFVTMKEEIFGPVVTLYIYRDTDFSQVLEICNQTSPYALTGAIFSTDRSAIDIALRTLRQAAGNFYINDKPSGAVVGQQPFGGGRASGTNDKAGSRLNLMRWCSPRTIKETLCPPRDYRYPFMA